MKLYGSNSRHNATCKVLTIKLNKYWTEQDPISCIETMEEYQGIQENIYDEIETVREHQSQSLVYQAEV